MPDDTTSPAEEQQSTNLPIAHIGMDDVPIYGCDHISAVLMPTDNSLILQMFSTIPPVPRLDGGPPESVSRRCIGQFHLTPGHAQNLARVIQEQLGKTNKESA